jgi:hypothetical protein
LALQLNNADIRSYYIGRDDVTGWMTPGGGVAQDLAEELAKTHI